MAAHRAEPVDDINEFSGFRHETAHAVPVSEGSEEGEKCRELVRETVIPGEVCNSVEIIFKEHAAVVQGRAAIGETILHGADIFMVLRHGRFYLSEP